MITDTCDMAELEGEHEPDSEEELARSDESDSEEDEDKYPPPRCKRPVPNGALPAHPTVLK